jgi:hypothetical protein
MNFHNINIIFQQILNTLSDYTLDTQEFDKTIKFIKSELAELYKDEIEMVNGIDYYESMLKNIIENDITKEDDDKIYGLTLICDQFLCINDKNKNYIQSKYLLIQCLMKSCIHQIWQRLFKISYQLDMQNIPEHINLANKLFKEIIEDSIISVKGYNPINAFN